MSMRNLRRGMSIVLSFALILSTMVLRPKSIQAVAVQTSLANPGFEEPVVNGKIPGWSALFSTTNENLKFELTNEKSASGNYSIKVYDNLRTASTGIISDPVNVIPGKAYTGRTKLYISNNTNVASLTLRFYDANNTQIIQSEIHNDGPKGFPAAQWVDVATPEKIAPANAKYARLIAFVTGYSIATAYYDDMAITYEDSNMTNSVNLSVPETAAPSQEFTVTLGVAEAVYQAGAEIQYDSQKLQLIEVKGAGDFADASATVTSEVYNCNIRINANLNKTEAGSQTVIAVLKFKTTGIDGSTWIKLNKITSLNGTNYILQEKNYNIQIVKPEPKTTLTNPGFEEPVVNGKIPGWSSLFADTNESLKFEVTNEKSASGSYSIKVYDNLRDKSVGFISDPIEITPGVAYTGKAKLLISATTNTATLNLRFYDADNKQIIQSEKHNYGSQGFPIGQWTDAATGELIAPDNAKYARLLGYVTGYSIATAYYDDMTIAFKATEPDPTSLYNPGYEEPIAGSAIPGWSSVFSQTGEDYKYEITNTQKASGSYSLKITDQRRDQSVAIISDPMTAIPGVAYTGKAKMFLEDNSTASLNVRFYDADGKQIAEQAQHFDTSKGFPVNQWVDAKTDTIVAPDNAKHVRFMAYTTTYAIAVAYYDDMAISYIVNNTPAKLDLTAPVAATEGQDIVVQINAAELKNLSSVIAKIYYDEQRLQFVKAVPTGSFAGDAATFTATNDSAAGKLVIDTAMQNSKVVNTNTSIAEITFKVIGSNGEAWVILDKESTMNGTFNPSVDKTSLIKIGTYPVVKLSDVEFSEPVTLGAPIADTVGLFDGAAGMEDGQPVMYTTVKGIPPTFHVISLNDYKVLRSIPLTGGGDSWSHRIAPDGTVYTAAGSQLWAYSPVTKTAQMVFTYPGENVFWAIDTDEAGNVYISTGPSSKVLKYDPVTKQGRDYGRMLASGDMVYARSIAYSKGYVYVGTSNAEIYKLNVTTGEKVEIGAPLNETGYVYDTDVVDDKFLIVRYDKTTTRYIYNIETGQWLDIKIPNSTSGLHIAKKSLDGKIYMPVGGKIVTFDINTYAIEETGMLYGSGFRGSDWVEVSDPDLPGKSLVTMNFAGKIVFFNPHTKTVKIYENILPPSASITHIFETVQDGNIVITGMQASKASIYNELTGRNTLIPMGQAGTVIPYDGKIYFGVYPKAEFYVYDPKVAQSTINPRKLFNIRDEQDRPITDVVGNGKIYIGSIPDYGKLGGAITVFDPSASDPTTAFKNYRNIVQDQSIISLAYKDGKIYGGTSINGGLSIDATAKEAKLFVWDTVTEEKVNEISLDIPGLVNPKAIGGLTIGPDGLLWGGVNGIVFAMDPDTMKLIKYKNLYPQDGSWGQWGSYNAKWSEDGLLYMFLGRRLTVIQPDTLEFKYFVDSEAFTIGEDGNIYYSPRENRTLMNRIVVKTKRPANLSITAPAIVTEDGEFNVTLRADQVLDLHKVSASISYDPQKLQFVSAKAEGGFNGSGITFAAEAISGIVHITAEQAGNDVVTADTNVAVLTFKAIGNPGDSTVLKLNKESEVAFADGVSFRQYSMIREQQFSIRILSADSTFIVKPGSINLTGGIKASVSINQNPDGPVHDGTEVVVFQLMKKDEIVSTIAIGQNIDEEETFTAFFTVPNPKNHLYQVKVFVIDSFSSDEAVSVNLSNLVTLD